MIDFGSRISRNGEEVMSLELRRKVARVRADAIALILGHRILKYFQNWGMESQFWKISEGIVEGTELPPATRRAWPTELSLLRMAEVVGLLDIEENSKKVEALASELRYLRQEVELLLKQQELIREVEGIDREIGIIRMRMIELRGGVK
jgi:hypothetical protein